MLIDARSVPENTIIEADVCIIGSGAAGITLAREFIGAPFHVCLLESGGFTYDKETQSLYKGENLGQNYFPLDVARLRYFGGSTNHWGGWCRPLDEVDFETREWIPHSGWPFDKLHLDPFYGRAQPICQLGPYAYESKVWETKQSTLLPFVGDRVTTAIFQFSQPPTPFGKVYRDGIVSAKNISTYLYANAVDIETTNPPHTVTRLRIACLQGNKFWVSGKLFILAAGGIENPRLLLLSHQVQNTGLGNQNDLVGRFFMEHLHIESSFFIASSPETSFKLYTRNLVNGTSVRGALVLSPRVLRDERLLAFTTFLNSYQSKGINSARILSGAIRRGDLPDDFIDHLGNVISDFDDIAVAAYRRFFKQNPSVKKVAFYNVTEQAPNPESRITLSSERDSVGKNRLRLDWRLSSIDKRSMRRAQEIIATELGRAGLGRLKIELDDSDVTWPASLTGGRHHMGTTRMHVDPKKGVVNDNCQIHGIHNLFIAGSSVFPTVGYANPTLTIVALAIRLADHMKRLMR
ncbi:MAG: GMC family oxidoreductase [Nitrososphaera sp.]|nr:GMC family oxidoreductase [Nitrososphaera sp.]